MSWKKFICFSLIVLIISVAAVSAEDNTTQIPQNNTPKTFEDIQITIDEACENATIELNGTYSSQGHEITINKPITITSNGGATLDAGKNSSVFNISNVNVCLKNLNIINSNSTSPAIFSQGNLNIENCTFKNNTVYIPFDGILPFDDEYYNLNRSAGAILSHNNLEITNCEFIGNYAVKEEYEYEYFEYYLTDWGGAVYSKGNCLITNSRFKDNLEADKNLTVLNSLFIASTITSNSNLYIENSSFSKSKNEVLNVKAKLKIINSNFTQNGGYVINAEGWDEKPCTIIICNSNFSNNSLKSSGYFKKYENDEESTTINCENADLFIYNSSFKNNTAGAINNHWGNTFILNSSFEKNSAYKGGAINSYNTTAINSTFKNNRASFAGAIFSYILTIDNCSFKANSEGAVGIEERALLNGEIYSDLTYLDNSLKKLKLIKASVGNLKIEYKSGAKVWIKLTYTESKKPVKNENVQIKIIKGNREYYDDADTNANGIAKFKVSHLARGTYKIIFNCDDDTLPQIETTFKIVKAKTIIKAKKVKSKYKKSRYFKIKVRHKQTKKPVKNTYVKLKIGKKTFKVKTNSKGIAKFNTKKLKVGKYTVKIRSGNSDYIMKAKSKIIIKR